MDFGPPSFEVDQHGFVRLGSVAVRVAGLTPAEAASKVRDAFSPRYFSDLEVEVARPQPHHAADGSQPFSSVPIVEPVAAGSRR